jgi:hypothetical protein
MQGKILWNKEGMNFFRVEAKWKEIYNSKEEMRIMYNGWERWITTMGKKIKVGDETTRTFHAVMATWYDETPNNDKKSNESEDYKNFGEDGYLSERACSRQCLAWQQGALRDEAMGVGRKDESD